MAVNQVSLSFYAPRWKRCLTSHPTARNSDGTPVQIGRPVPLDDVYAPLVLRESVAAWLTENGFAPAEWNTGRSFVRGRVQSIFGAEQDIIAHIHDEADEVTNLYIRFTLPRPGPPPLSSWTAFVVGLCERFMLRVEPDGVGRCSATEFKAAVINDRFYQRFAMAFGWKLGDAEPAAAPGRGGE